MSITLKQIAVTLRSLITKDELCNLTKEVLLAAKEENSPIKQFYLRCASWVQIAGFRKGKLPPFPPLLSSANNVINRHDEAFLELISTLTQYEPDKVEVLHSFMTKEFAQDMAEGFNEIEQYRQFIVHVAELAKEKLKIDWELPRLQLTIAALTLEPQTKVEEVAVAVNNSVQAEILTKLNDLSADDPFWEDLDSFFAAVSDLKSKKEESAQMNEDLKSALATLHSKYAQHLTDYFQFAISSWTLDNIISGKKNAVLESLEQIVDTLEEHTAALLQPPQTVLEREKLNVRLSTLENEISANYQQLAGFFIKHERKKEKQQAEVVAEIKPDQTITPGKKKTPKPAKDERKENIKEEDPPELTAKKEVHKTKVSDEKPLARKPRMSGKPPKEIKAKPTPPDPVIGLVENGDFAGAFWKARALEITGKSSSIPSWLLASMESARYLTKPEFKQAKDFVYPLKYGGEQMDSFAELGVLGAGMIATLLVPASGAMGWLVDQKQLTSLQKIITLIREFSYRNIALTRRDILYLSNREQLDTAINEAAGQCQTTINNNVDRRFGLPRVNRIWQKIFDKDSQLRSLVEKGASDSRKDLEQVKVELENWARIDQIEDYINTVDIGLLNKKNNPLEIYEKERLIRAVLDVVDAVEQWVALAENTLNGGDSWKQRHIKQFIEELDTLYEPALQELETAAATDDVLMRTGYLYIKQNLQLLQNYLDPNFKNDDDGWYLKGNSIESILAKRLLHYPKLKLETNGLPSEADLEYLATTDLKPVPDWHLLSQGIFRAWLEKQDHRFLDVILLGLVDEDTTKDQLKSQASKQLQGSRDTLEYHCRQTVENIERALVNGVIEEEERVSFLTVVEGIEVDSALNFQYEFAKLREIDEKLEEATKLRIEHLKVIWEELKPNLDESAEQQEAEEFREMIETALKQNDTRVVDEYLVKLREHVEQGEDLALGQIYQQPRDYLDEFYRFRRSLERIKDARFFDARRAARQQKTWGTLHYGNIPPKQLDQIDTAFEAWHHLTRRRDNKFQESVINLFNFLGFTVNSTVDEIPLPESGSGYFHILLRMEASEQAKPFPSFGSLTAPRFNVLMVWERPGADNIGTAIHEARLGAQSNILLYFGRIGDSIRREITLMTRRRNLPIAILDETLLLFLTGERDARLRAFLRSSVPYGTVIPYTPEVAGDVPSEIFYGREEAVKQLQQKDGSCLIYGGRQMGKSALLREVRRQVHDPSRHQYAWIEDVKTFGDSYSNEKPAKIWSRFWGHLLGAGLVERQLRDDEEIINAIERLLVDRPELQIILMLDEADNFLNQDSLNGFKIVTTLRRLMAVSGRRFKVIFAGLQHVQRFQGLPNQPLAHFGAPILVGPLESHAATALVREPLEALGFELDDSCVYRILSFTNYHPGLIQIFCYHLLERLYSRMITFPLAHKPLLITTEDVDSIYLQEEVRKGIRERFEWTLALDKRYQVITWSMIAVQMEDRDSYGRRFSIGELASIVKDYWAAEFEGMAIDEFRGLLQELVGLGVLYSSQGKYCLKSPNLVRLMGSEGDIENRLYDFINKPAWKELDPDSFHHLIDREKRIYSNFTFEQARNINQSSDFRVILTSQALGIANIEQTIKNLYKDAEKTRFKRIGISVKTRDAMDRLITKEIDRARKNGFSKLVFYLIADKPEVEPFEAIAAAYEFYNKIRSKREISFFFVLNPSIYWSALKFAPELIEELAKEGAILRVRPWDEMSIGQYLDDYGKLSNDEIRESIYSATGGWPYLMEELMARCAEIDPQEAAFQIGGQLADDHDFRHKFVDRLELPQDEGFWTVLRFILKNEEVPTELVSPQLIPEVNEEDCLRTLNFASQFGLVEIIKEECHVQPVVKAVLSP